MCYDDVLALRSGCEDIFMYSHRTRHIGEDECIDKRLLLSLRGMMSKHVGAFVNERGPDLEPSGYVLNHGDMEG